MDELRFFTYTAPEPEPQGRWLVLWRPSDIQGDRVRPLAVVDVETGRQVL